MLSEIIRSISAGAVFGAALTTSRVFLPHVIIDQMRFRDFHMLEVFLTASAASALILFAFEKAGIAQRNVRRNSSLNWFSNYDGNVLGGALLGIGMSLTGACPGTVLPQLAHGIASARGTLVGGLLGGVAYAKVGNALTLRKALGDRSKPESKAETIDSKLHISPQGMLISFETIAVSTIILSALLLPGKASTIMPTVTGGICIGIAQATSVLVTSNTLGVSTAYEQFGSYLWKLTGQKNVAAPPNPPKAIFFATGIFVGSFISSHFLPALLAVEMTAAVSTMQALVGGFLLAFGARLAGGCTSGHGLSGLASFSYSSLITTAAMFLSGIAAQSVNSLRFF